MTARASSSPGRRLHVALVLLLAVAAWAAAVYLRVKRPVAVPEPAPSVTASVGSAPATTASSAPTVAPTTEPSGSATANDGPDAGDGADGEVTRCVASLFPEGTFALGSLDLSFVCEEESPRRATTLIQSQVALGHWGTGKANAGMREWAVLGWYEIGALALIRGQCCESPRPLDWATKLACPFDQAVSRIEQSTHDRDPVALAKAIAEYARQATCLTRQGQASNFGQAGLPGPGVSALRKMTDRARKTWKRAPGSGSR